MLKLITFEKIDSGSTNGVPETGRKVFYFNRCHNDAQLSETVHNCATELAVRHYLQLISFDYASAMIPGSVTVLPQSDFSESSCSSDIICFFRRPELNDPTYCKNHFAAIVKELEGIIFKAKELGIHSISIEIECLKDDVWTEFKHAADAHNQRTLDYMAEVFHILKEAKSAGLVFLDLKPENLLRKILKGSMSMRLVLNDFDVSLLLPDNSTDIDLPAGRTLLFSSPEQVGCYSEWKDGKSGYAADIFAACLISYYLLNGGDFPLEFSSSTEDARKRDFEWIKKGNLSIEPPRYGSPKLKELICKGLSIDPRDRPDAADLLDAVQEEKQTYNPEYYRYPGAPSPPQEHYKKREEDSQNNDTSRTKSAPVEQNNNHTFRLGRLGIVLFFVTVLAILFFCGWLFWLWTKKDTPTPATEYTQNQLSGIVTENPHEETTTSWRMPETTTVDTSVNSVSSTSASSTMTTSASTVTVSNNARNPDKPAATTTTTTTSTSTTSTMTTNLFKLRRTSYTVACKDGSGEEKLEGFEIVGLNGRITDGKVEILEPIDGIPVISIGEGAFQTVSSQISELNIPSLQYIGKNAFAGNFTGVKLNLTGVRYIGANAFANCPSIRAVILDKNLTAIGEKAFFNNNADVISRTFDYPDIRYAFETRVLCGEYALGMNGTYTLNTKAMSF